MDTVAALWRYPVRSMAGEELEAAAFALDGGGRFDPRRFRANLVIATTGATHGFPEDEWVGRTLAVGKEVRLAVTEPCAGA